MDDTELRWPEPRPAPPRGSLLKSPFPVVSDLPAPQPTRQRPPVEDDRDADGQERAAPPRRRSTRRKPRRLRATILKVVLSVFLLATCSSLSYAGVKLYRLYQFAKTVTGQALPTITPGKQVVQATPLPPDLKNVSAFNLLLLGSDTDSKPQFKNAVLTQTDIVVRLDLAHHKVTMLSIPRDMYINNDYGACCDKLDEISGSETDGFSDPLNAKRHGFAHTEATIEADFGIPINAYAWVGLDGFVKVIDSLGGVDVDVLHPIIDDAYPNDVSNTGDPFGYKRLDIPAGPQHLDGVTALEYVRSRHSDGNGDFGRSQRQQSVLIALKKKLNNPAILTQLDTLASDLQGSVLTDLSVNQAIQLAQFAKDLKSTDIAQMVLSVPDYGKFQDIPTGPTTYKSVIQPNWPAIRQKVGEIFPDAAATVNLGKPSATDAQTIQTEGARILIENGSGVPGLAAKLASILKNDGFTVLTPQDADRVYLATQLEQYTPKTTGTARVLEQMLGVLAQTPGASAPPGADIVIIIGKDIAQALQRA